MDRRTFSKNIAIGAAVAGISSAKNMSRESANSPTFNLNYAPHLGMFKTMAGDDPIDQLNYMADQGFRAFEDNGMKQRVLDVQKKMAETMQKRNLEMGVFVGHTIHWDKPNLASGDLQERETFLYEIRESINVALRVNAKWITVVPGHLDLRLDKSYQTNNVVETLKQASAILEPFEMTMVLEPLNFRDHPGLFLTESPQAYQICKAVNSPSCKILFDIYHQQIQEGNLIPNIEACWDEIAYFQIGDNPGRKEPTTGEINYKNVFKYIHSKGYTGILGMEHGNSLEGAEGEKAVITAYKEVDNFLK